MDHSAPHRPVSPRVLAVSEPELIDALSQVAGDLLAVRMRQGHHRVMIGVCGAPGAGKSTVAAALAQSLSQQGHSSVVFPMDGFHLAQSQLAALGLTSVKGAPATFDAHGFVALLRRVHGATHPVYAPVFHRDLEESFAAALCIPPTTQVVIVEGNYLLLDEEPWAHVRDILDATWALCPPQEVRQERLIARHIAYGKDPVAARAWALGSDEVNAELINQSVRRADLLVEVSPPDHY